MPPLFALRSQHIVTPEGVREGAVLVREGVIEDVVNAGAIPGGTPVDDVGQSVVMPGLIDPHVHINEPGHTEWEGFETATRAAAAGGITTLVDMPLNSEPVTTTLAALEAKQQAAAGKLWVDVGFYAGLVPGNTPHLPALLDAGVLGVKAFLCHSGLDAFPSASEHDLRAAMPLLAARSVPLLVHAELPAVADLTPTDPQSYAAYLASRPRRWECDAIRLMIDLCRETRCPVHIVHLSAADALPMLQAARAQGLPITVETAPHYLAFAAEDIPDGDTRFKCAPPIRERNNRERLWQALRRGDIDLIATDHSPCPPTLKLLDTGDFQRAWGGIASLQLSLPVAWTAARARSASLENIALWMSHHPARFLGIDHRKGAIAKGYDADLVVWDPEAPFTVDPAMLYHRHKITPYDGMTLYGVVEKTFLRGTLVYEHGRHAGPPQGEQVLRIE